ARGPVATVTLGRLASHGGYSLTSRSPRSSWNQATRPAIATGPATSNLTPSGSRRIIYDSSGSPTPGLTVLSAVASGAGGPRANTLPVIPSTRDRVRSPGLVIPHCSNLSGTIGGSTTQRVPT